MFGYTTMAIILNNKTSFEVIENIKQQYMTLISKLSTTNENISNLQFINQVNEIGKTSDIIVAYFMRAEPDKNGNRIILVGTGTVFYEAKISHNLGYVAHIEDVVVCDTYRSLGIATQIMSHLIHLSKEKKCYKIILDCKRDVCKVYEKSGFIQSGIQMKLTL